MAYTDSTPFKIPRRYQAEGGVSAETITGHKTLVYTDSQVQLLKTTTGAHHCTCLDPEDGAHFWINVIKA